MITAAGIASLMSLGGEVLTLFDFCMEIIESVKKKPV